MAAGVADGALIVDTGLDNSGFMKNARQFRGAVEGLKNSVHRAGQAMSTASNGYLQGLNRAAGTTRKLDAEIKKLRTEAAKLQMEMAKDGGLTKNYSAVADEIAETEAEIERLQKKQQDWAEAGMDPDSAPFEELDQQIFDLMDKIDALKAKQESMRASGDAYTPEAREMQQAYADVNREIDSLLSKREQALSVPPGWEDMATVSGAVARALAQVKTAAATAFYAVQHPAEALDRAFVKIAVGAGRALAAIGKLAGTAAIGFLRKLATGAKNAAIQLAKLAGSAISGGLKRLGAGLATAVTAMAGFHRATKQSNSGMGLSLKNLLRYGLGIRSLFALFNRLRGAVRKAFGELAARNEPVRASINSLQSALGGLKGSLATAFSPILTAVAPALTTLINLLTAAVNAIGAFMAALTGQRVYSKAVAGLSDIGGAASSASSSAKELKRELAGFDNLEILKDNSGGGGGGGAGAGFGFEEEEIAGGIVDFVAKLKELWANADYEGIGREIAGAINRAFEKAKDLISWDNLGAKITEAVDAITGIFNGLVDEVDWTLIGQTFGEGVNTIVNTANQLLTKIDWQNLGKKISEGLNGLVDEVNWENLGAVFGNRFNAIADALRGAARNFDWSAAGTAFATAVSGLLNTVNWKSMADSATSLFNGVLRALQVAANEFDWSSQGKNFATALNGLITGFDWAGLGETATASINGVLRALRAAVNAFEWSSQGKNFASMLNSLITGFDWSGLGETAAASFNGVLRSIRAVAANFEWSSAGTNFATALNSLIKDFDWEGLASTATASINGPIRALRAAVNGFNWSSQGTNFASTVNSIIKDFDWEGLGSLAAEGIEKPLESIRAAVSTFDFKEAAVGFANSVNAFFKNEKLWENAGTIISDSVKGLFTWGTEFLDNLDTQQMAKDIKTFLGQIDWGGIARAIWDFLIAAFRALGNFVYELLFPKEATDRAVAAFIEDANVALGKSDLNFGLDPNFVPDKEKIEQLQTAISMSLARGEWTEIPITLDIPDKNVDMAYQRFVERWNELHPEAPIDPTLPRNAGKKVQGEWNKQSPDLDADVEPEIDTTKFNEEWDAFAGKPFEVTAGVGLQKNGWTSVSAWVNGLKGTTKILQAVGLAANAWKSVSAWVSGLMGKTSVTQAVGLQAKAWASVSAWVATMMGRTDITQGIGLAKKSWDSVSKWVGGLMGNTNVAQKVGLVKQSWDSVSAWVKGNMGKTNVNKDVGLKKLDWESVSKWVKGKMGKTAVNQGVGLTKNWSGTPQKALGLEGLKANVKVGLEIDESKKTLKLTGGMSKGSVSLVQQALGGIFANGIWRAIPQYARGTLHAGSLFAAGEAGPELVGHIGGRTEVLNKSQLAATMFAAVSAGMLDALGKVRFRMPAMAGGSVVPYEIAAQIALTGSDIQDTLNANNEDLIQTIISVAGQLVAAVGRIQTGQAPGGLSAQQLIGQINRQTNMFGASPLKGV